MIPNTGKIPHPLFYRHLKIGVSTLCVILVTLFVNRVDAQLQAAFTINKEGGCKPLTVQFTNTSTGTAAGVTYSWDLGNGNTSALVSPGATYVEEKVYTVTLTAKQGSETSTSTKQITVYKTPSVDFAATPTKGCMPLEVSFTSTATPGDGTITRYLWDFGDGQTADGAAITAPKHTYTFAQQAPVSLTVTNSFGCFNTKSSGGLIQVNPLPVADFEWAKNPLCGNNEPIPFQNKTLVQAGTSWQWDFGDGAKSTAKDPVHKFSTEGTFKVSLVATTVNGCRDSVHYFVSNKLEMLLPANVCEGDTIELKHNVPRPFLFENWYVNGDRVAADYQGKHFFVVKSPATLKVKLDIETDNCTATKEAEIQVNPIVKKEMLEKKRLNPCELPAKFELSEQSGFGASWSWFYTLNNISGGNAKTANLTFEDPNGNGYFRLHSITDKGCKSDIRDTVLFAPPEQRYDIIVGTSQWSPNTGNTCVEFELLFGIRISFPYQNDLVEYLWNFGDGTTSTEATPRHKYESPGEYQVSLKYKTAAGCTGELIARTKAKVIAKPKATLEIEGGNNICGNNVVLIKVKTNDQIDFKHLEIFDPAMYESLPGNTNLPRYDYYLKFINSGNFSGFFRYGDGGCFDTIKLDNFFNVSPPFNHGIAAYNTCDGNRLTFRFTDSSKNVEKWIWDFGDGKTKEFSSKQDTVYHTYEKTGYYNAKLTVTNGACQVSDSIYIAANEKPTNMVLKNNLAKECFTHPFQLEISGYEERLNIISGTGPFNVIGIQYKDLSFDDYYIHYGIFLYHLNQGNDGFRLILQDINQCIDTTNFIDLKIIGPIVKLGGLQPSYCINEILSITDESIGPFGTELVNWKWSMYMGNTSYEFESDKKENFIKKLTDAGDGSIQLEVTDNEGCTAGEYYTFSVLGPRSVFSASAELVAIGTEVFFINKSDYNSFPLATPTWILPDGSTSNRISESFLFKEEGEFFVKLFHTTPGNACSDTMIVKILVRAVNAQFTQSISYVNNNGCPPAIVRFTSTATNAVRYGWNFGNGAIGGNQTTVTHTYNQPGIYQVWHYSYDENNNVDSSFDFIEIKGPYALISADKLSACNNLQVTLNAEVKNADSYTWDLGDGTISSSNDTKITHQYLTAGQYTPSLILEDSAGCKATSVLPQKIIVDSLRADFSFAPLRICAGSRVAFTGQTSSFSASQLNATLTYKWLVNNVQQGTEKNFGYVFTEPGSYPVKFEVSSPYGCQAVVQKAIQIEPPLNAAIAGKNSVCKGDTASFMASATAAGLTWRWLIQGQATSIISAQTSPVQWNTPGNYTISLLADNGACTDSVVHLLTVHDLPTIITGPQNARVCLGDTLNLTVQGNGVHTWQPQATMMQDGNNLARVWPQQDSWFKVNSISAQGCRSSDSMLVAVVKPFRLQVNTAAEACLGELVNLSASGADTYQWIPASGLSNAAMANPVANITATTNFRVFGRDRFGCFADSATVQVTIHPRPMVNAGPDATVLGGESVSLNATSSLPGVSWTWTPAAYLSCANCANPVSRPLNDIGYVVRATTAKGCTSTDSLNITVLCSKETIFIPTGFTPNGDGLNDRFGVLGGGVTTIGYFRITDRWGKTVFERNNVAFGSTSSFWDGNYPNGLPAASGSYIYAVEVTCSTGTSFRYSGSVTLLR